MIDYELKHDLINKFVAVGLWVRSAKDCAGKGYIRDCREACDWVIKAAEEGIEKLRKER
jgi:hypothetical protein